MPTDLGQSVKSDIKEGLAGSLKWSAAKHRSEIQGISVVEEDVDEVVHLSQEAIQTTIKDFVVSEILAHSSVISFIA